MDALPVRMRVTGRVMLQLPRAGVHLPGEQAKQLVEPHRRTAAETGPYALVGILELAGGTYRPAAPLRLFGDIPSAMEWTKGLVKAADDHG